MTKKKIEETLKKMHEEIYYIIDKRESSYDYRTESWQESERGEEFLSKTEEVKDCFDYLGDAISSFERYNDKQTLD